MLKVYSVEGIESNRSIIMRLISLQKSISLQIEAYLILVARYLVKQLYFLFNAFKREDFDFRHKLGVIKWFKNRM